MACNGQLLPIAQYNALFALLGTNFGGNGTNNFGLPNFQGRVPMGFGTGLSNHPFGQVAGTESVTLGVANLPAHNHAPVVQASTGTGTSNAPSAAAYLGALSPDSGGGAINAYTKTAGTLVNLAGVSESNVGGSAPVSIVQPYLAIGFTIAVTGLFPSRS
jgi:microcystin-dependent protein